MKLAKIIAAALAFTIVCGAAPLGSSAPMSSIAADTEDEAIDPALYFYYNVISKKSEEK